MVTRSRLLRLLMSVAIAGGLFALGLPPGVSGADPAPCAGAGTLCAGAASVDMTWHTGSGQGQYGSDGNDLTSNKFDPFHHQTKMVPSDGAQSRLFTKAIVIKGSDGQKAAFVKTELYLQQDVLTRRVGELVAGDPLAPEYQVNGLNGTRVMLAATHNHSAPYYASTAWGVWLFADAFDFRMFEATARRIALAIKQADENLEPAKIGAAVTPFAEVQRNILGPATADDGSPAGFPHDWFDKELTVIRFDSADGSNPIGAIVNLGMHPESIESTNLLSSDFVGVLERITERAMGKVPGAAEGPVVAWGQGSVGDVEPDQSRGAPPEAKREYWHRNYAQMERMAQKLSAAVLDTWADVANNSPAILEKFVPFSTDLPVGMVDYYFSGPLSHPLPTVSNCKSAYPAAPVVGLPDCRRPDNFDPPQQLGTTIDLLQGAGIPVPDNIGSTPSYEGAQESTQIHLQALRLGEILIASCPCEPVSDMVVNFKSRADRGAANIYNGYRWPCEQRVDGKYCDFKQAGWRADDWRLVNEAAYERMVAQIENDASGWEQSITTRQGETEAENAADIFGNFTHREIQQLPCTAGACEGYRIPIMIGQANDYVGYVVTYREYMRGDHYRKALTAFGPHTADYVNTRLVQMGAQLQGGTEVPTSDLSPGAAISDSLIQRAKVLAAGGAGTVGTPAYEAAIPDDGGTPARILSASSSMQRFRAASITWEGGSNWTDNPHVVVQKQLQNGDWQTVATQEGGEVVVTLKYDSYTSTAPLDWLTGGKAYQWTATYEVYDQTPSGIYRFVVDGRHRKNRTANPYQFESPFTVSVWEGIQSYNLGVDTGAATASFKVSGVERTIALNSLETDDDAVLSPSEIHYPDSYTPAVGYIRTNLNTSGPHRYCYRCTFRPWADTGEISSAAVTVLQSDGNAVEYPAALSGNSWVASNLDLANGDYVQVERAGVLDEFGNINGAPSELIGPLSGLYDRPGAGGPQLAALGRVEVADLEPSSDSNLIPFLPLGVSIFASGLSIWFAIMIFAAKLVRSNKKAQ